MPVSPPNVKRFFTVSKVLWIPSPRLPAKILGSVDASCEIERIRIKTLGNKTKYIQALPLHHSQQEVERTAEYSIFEYLLRPTYDFCQELLSHGSDLEVLSPQPLREQIKSIVKNMEQFYG